MALDDDTASLLSQMASAGAPALHELEVEPARLALKEVTVLHDIAEEPVASMEQRTLTFATNQQVNIRVYRPAAEPSPSLLVLFHGGGWALGDLDTHDNMCRYLCHHARPVVVNVEYRLAPEHPFPEGLEDCIATTRWVYEHAVELGSTQADLAVIGDSAGGNLAAVVCQLARQSGGPRIAKQVLLYPSVDLSETGDFASREEFGGGEYFLSTSDVNWMSKMYLPKGAAPNDARVSPLHARDLSGLPQTLVITAGHDMLRDEGKAYADKLEAAGNQAVSYLNFASTIHGFCSFGGAISAGEQALARVAQWLRE